MADAIHYAAGVRSAALGKQTRQPIVKALEYWLDSGERMKVVMKNRPEEFRQGIESKVNTRTAEKVAWANSQLDETREENGWRIITATTNSIESDDYILIFTRANGR